MDSIDYSATQTKLAQAMRGVCDNHEPVLIKPKKGAPVVMVSLNDFKALTSKAESESVQGVAPDSGPQEQGRNQNMPWISPYLTVRNAANAIDFYQRAFGFELRNTMDDGGVIVHAEMTYHDMVIMMGPEKAFGATALTPVSGGFESPLGLYVYCENVDELFAQATEAGARVSYPPQNMPWGERVCKIFDPEGHAWSFATAL